MRRSSSNILSAFTPALFALLRPRLAVGHDDEHRHDLAVGQQIVGDHVGAAQLGPMRVVVTGAVQEIEHRYFFVDVP